jgi:hypothetical protein
MCEGSIAELSGVTGSVGRRRGARFSTPAAGPLL